MPLQFVEPKQAPAHVEDLSAHLCFLNSIKHNPLGCRILLSLRRMENTIQLIVQDDGIGLSEEKLQELKEKPHYLESTDVLETIRAAERAEAAYERRMYRYKAHYSLDCETALKMRSC